MPFFELEGDRLFYQLTGEAGTPVLLVMGMGLTQGAWAPQVPALSQHHRVLRFDHRGVGHSSGARRISRVPAMAQDALALLDHLGFERAHVVGISLGGLVAEEIALAARERVLSLSLLATCAGGGGRWLPSPASLWWMPQVFFRRGLGGLFALQNQLLSRTHLAAIDRRELAQRMAEQLAPGTPVKVALGQLAGFVLYSARKRLAELAGLPVLVAHGGKDILIPWRQGRGLARCIPGAEWHLFPTCAHGLTLEATDEINRLLLGHFERAEP